MKVCKQSVLFILALLLLSLFLFAFPDSMIVFVISALFSSVCGLYGLFVLIRKPNFLRLFNVMAVSLLLGYAFGTAIFYFGSIYSIGYVDLTRSIYPLEYNYSDLSSAILLVLVTCALLFGLAIFEPPIAGKFATRFERTVDDPQKYILLSAVILIGAYITGQIGFMGIHTGEGGKVGIFGAFAFLLVPPFLPIIACDIVRTNSFRHKITLTPIFLLFLLSSVLFGRRIFLYSLILIFIGLSISRYGPRKRSVKRWLTMTAAIPVLAVIVLSSFSLFFAMRLATDVSRHEVSFFDLLRNTQDVIKYDAQELNEQLLSNLTERPFILPYLAGLLAAERRFSPLLGREVVHAFLSAIPSLFSPNKLHSLPKAPEEFVHPAFGLSVFDGPNTIMTAGLDDFGICGAIIYPVMLGFIYVIFFRVISRYLPPVLVKIVGFRLIFQLLYVEQALGSILTSGLRDLVLITGVFLIIDKFPHVTFGSLVKERV